MKKFVSVECLAAASRALVIYLIVIGSSTNAAAPGVKVIDDFDHVVTLPAPAQRIISLAPHNTENLFSAGAGNRVVGVVEYSDYPPEAKHIPSVGSHVQFNLEAIIALEPDLVVAWRSGNNRDALKQIEQLGIPVYYSEPRSFESIVENIQELAALSGTTELQDPDLSAIQQNIESARADFADQKSLDVFYQVWTDPLMTLNGDHLISRVLEVCGTRHLFAELSIIAPRISIEAVVDANPDVIVTGMVNNQKPDMSVWEKWHTIKAVKNQHFIYVDSDVMHRHTLRMLKGVQSFCHQLDEVRRAFH